MEEESSLIEKTCEQMQHGSAPLSHQQKTGARQLAVALRFELLVPKSAKQSSSSDDLGGRASTVWHRNRSWYCSCAILAMMRKSV